MSGLAGGQLPERIALAGNYAQLEPLGPQHVKGLFEAVVPERFAYLFEAGPKTEAEMAQWVAGAVQKNDPLYFAVIDRASGRAEGRQSLMRITPEHGVIEIGGIYWGPGISRSRVTTEALYLHARYVFDELGYRRFEWKCNDLNEPSKQAARRFGFVFEGVFRQHMIVKGKNRDTAWFSTLDSEWPRVGGAFKAWLDPANFDAAGLQKTALAAKAGAA